MDSRRIIYRSSHNQRHHYRENLTPVTEREVNHGEIWAGNPLSGAAVSRHFNYLNITAAPRTPRGINTLG